MSDEKVLQADDESEILWLNQANNAIIVLLPLSYRSRNMNICSVRFLILKQMVA